MNWSTVDSPVKARFGPFLAYPMEGVPDISLPWAWCGITRLYLRVGGAQVSKSIKAKAAHHTADTPTPEESDRLFTAMDADMRRLIERHGIPAPTIVWDRQPPSAPTFVAEHYDRDQF